jgi:O-methyltransferase
MSLYHKSLHAIYNWQRKRRYYRIYERFRDFTMIPAASYVDNLRLAEKVRDLDGCVVECGVWRGGMIAGIAAILGSNRDYFLFDSFEGLPPAREIDGKAALDWQNDTASPAYYNNCSASAEFAKQAMTHVATRSFHLHGGWFQDTLLSFKPSEPIALLRLDADWYDSTITCLEHLFEYVAPGGLILVDDYYAWDGCSRALHDFLSRRSATERIRSFGDVCYLLKM